MVTALQNQSNGTQINLDTHFIKLDYFKMGLPMLIFSNNVHYLSF